MSADWIPIFTVKFSDEEILKPTYMFSSVFRDGLCVCKLCEEHVSGSEREQAKHRRRHEQELREWRERRRAQQEREAAERLRATKAERDLERRVLGDEAADGTLPHKKRLYNRITSARYKLNHPEKNGHPGGWPKEELKELEGALERARAEYDDYVKEATT